MKKVFSIIALVAMTLSLSSFTVNNNPSEQECAALAWDAGSDAEDLQFDEDAVYEVTEFVYDACINGRDWSLLMLVR